jgi:hypothetical protein
MEFSAPPWHGVVLGTKTAAGDIFAFGISQSVNGTV